MIDLNFRKYAKENVEALKNLTISLCQIPAPSHFEHKRANFCENWFRKNCTDDVYTDQALNVICSYGNKDAEKTIVFMAHMDTVFPDTEPMSVIEKDQKLFCPGVGDDTVNLAILMLCAKYIFKTAPKTNYRILFVANSCEEGLGNLKGCKELMKNYGNSVDKLISFDLDTSTLIDKAVGSHRYLIKVKTSGGHSYFDFGNENAIRLSSEIIQRLYSTELPDDLQNSITYNVGTISGGTSVNTIAQSCEFTYEYRSVNDLCLEYMNKTLDDVITHYQDRGYDVKAECIGKRPGMTALKDQSQADWLVELAENIHLELFGRIPKRMAGSTDCNVPLSMGITALCVGLVKMSGAHTKEEYVELDSLEDGITLALTMINEILKN